MENRPKGAIGVYVINKQNQLLLLLRTSTHGKGTWAPTGGHIEYGERFFDAARRESLEESGIDVTKIEVMGVTSNVYDKEKKHYITVHVKALKYKGKEKVMEPEKASEIKWVDLDKLHKNMFPSNISFFALNPLCLCDSGKNWKKCHGK